MEEEKPTLYLDCSVFDEQRETLSFFGGRNLIPRSSSLLPLGRADSIGAGVLFLERARVHSKLTEDTVVWNSGSGCSGAALLAAKPNPPIISHSVGRVFTWQGNVFRK